MALRSGYKGFKKLLAPLKVIRPGILSIDLDVLMEKSLVYKGVFSSVDLNSFTNTGIYVLNGSLNNNPEGSNYGTMIVYPSAGGGIGQIYYKIQWDSFYTRRYYQGAWSNWYKYTGTELT